VTEDALLNGVVGDTERLVGLLEEGTSEMVALIFTSGPIDGLGLLELGDGSWVTEDALLDGVVGDAERLVGLLEEGTYEMVALIFTSGPIDGLGLLELGDGS